MNAIQLRTRRVEKPWGRRDLLPAFGEVAANCPPVGEIWFEHPAGADPDLLVKYLFTSEKLSIQVHPDDAAAKRAGHRQGKDEAWVVLAAEPDALIGIGLRQAATKEALRAAAVDGSIEQMVDWRQARAGDFYYSPAGTVHALGPGLKLIEVQQNVDLTYRLYDYGRPRALHLDDAIAVADPVPYRAPFAPYRLSNQREILAQGGKFVLERWEGALSHQLDIASARPVWLIPVAGQASVDGETLEAGTVWMAEGPVSLALEAGADLLVAYQGTELHDLLLG